MMTVKDLVKAFITITPYRLFDDCQEVAWGESVADIDSAYWDRKVGSLGMDPEGRELRIFLRPIPAYTYRVQVEGVVNVEANNWELAQERLNEGSVDLLMISETSGVIHSEN